MVGLASLLARARVRWIGEKAETKICARDARCNIGYASSTVFRPDNIPQGSNVIGSALHYPIIMATAPTRAILKVNP